MNTPTIIQIKGPVAQAQTEFQATVMNTNGCDRFEFKDNKGYAFPIGKSKPQIFRMEVVE